MVRDSAPLKGDCNEQDRWRRPLDDDDLEGEGSSQGDRQGPWKDDESGHG